MKNQAKIQSFAYTYTQVSKIGHTLIHRALFSQMANISRPSSIVGRIGHSYIGSEYITSLNISVDNIDDYELKLNLYNIISHIG